MKWCHRKHCTVKKGQVSDIEDVNLSLEELLAIVLTKEHNLESHIKGIQICNHISFLHEQVGSNHWKSSQNSIRAGKRL